MKKLNQKGFTLAELLIVVAIIAVLVAIAIPVFGSQLERSRETTDAANLRSAYAAATVAVFDSSIVTGTVPGVSAGPVELKQTQDKFTHVTESIGGVSLQDASYNNIFVRGAQVYVNVDVSTGKPTFTKDNPTTNYVKINPLTGETSS